MRIYRVRIDVLICMGLAFLLALGTGKLAEWVCTFTYDGYVAAHTAAPGEIGGAAGKGVFRAQNVNDLLSHDTFTVISQGIEYRNVGGGYYGGKYFNVLTLPSGETVAAHINDKGIQYEGEFYTSEKTLPVGRVVWEDIYKDTTFINQIQHNNPLSRTNFYIDMMGNGGALNFESYSGGPKAFTQIATWIVSFPLLHMLGAKVGIFPYIFPPKKLRKSEWE